MWTYLGELTVLQLDIFSSKKSKNDNKILILTTNYALRG